MQAVALRCEHREDIPCVDDPAPRFGWALESAEPGDRQTAYRVLVAERAEDLAAERGTLWDSGTGRVRRDARRPLRRPAAAGGGRVRVERAGLGRRGLRVRLERARALPDRAGGRGRRRGSRAIRAHDPAMPVPGTDKDLDPTDFLMRRLRPCPFFRRSFRLDREIRRATLYATARGVVELELNGARVGDAVLAPGWTDYDQRIEYGTHDVTELVRAGENVLGAIVGDGWYAGFVGMDPRRPGNHYGRDPELLCELHLEHADGTRTVIATDGSWRATTGPFVYSDLLMGERYDARRELGAWSEPGGGDGAGWHPVRVRERDDVRLVPERGQPIRVTEEVRPVAVTERAPGVHVFDLGQNMVGWVRLAVEGERGTRVQLRFAEMLEPDGSLYLENLRSARALDTYVLRGGGPEVFEPRFTFHGFRYVEVTGLPAEPTLDTLTGRVVHSDTPRSGWFECSDEMVNQLWRNINWGQRGNFVSVPTDCPQRDERLGWTADAQVFVPDRVAEHGHRRVHDQVGRRPARRPAAERRLPRRRARARLPPRRRARVGRRRDHRALGDVAALRRPPAARAPLGGDGALHGPPRAPQPRPPVDGAPRQRLRRLAVGRRAHAARRAGHGLLGLRRGAHGGDRRGARQAGPRGALHAPAGRHRRRLQPRLRRRGRLHRGRHADRRTSSRSTWTSSRRSCAHAPPSAWWRTSSATAGT